MLDPKTRQFSEFKKYIDDTASDLQDKKILMYCTGGVRCERASAYLCSKGLTDIHQLHGGVFQYQQDFPDGGYFKGKNFVYDKRIAMPYPNDNGEIIGVCQICTAPYDDYRSKVRCSTCRMLVLICDTCREQLQNGTISETEFDSNVHVNADSIKCENCSSQAT